MYAWLVEKKRHLCILPPFDWIHVKWHLSLWIFMFHARNTQDFWLWQEPKDSQSDRYKVLSLHHPSSNFLAVCHESVRYSSESQSQSEPKILRLVRFEEAFQWARGFYLGGLRLFCDPLTPGEYFILRTSHTSATGGGGLIPIDLLKEPESYYDVIGL